LPYDDFADPARLHLPEPRSSAVDSSLRGYALAGYALHLAGWFTGGLTSLIAVILAYVKRGDARGTVYASHFANQITVFWWSLLWTVLGFVLLLIGIGYVVWVLAGLWFLYRVVKGIIRALDREPF
jgi:uncharacterized membrane protein